jgi:hypothetical protein
MNIKDMQDVWSSQNGQSKSEPIVLASVILRKSKAAFRRTNMSELFLIWLNAGSAVFILSNAFFSKKIDYPIWILCNWMFLVAIYILLKRNKRIKSDVSYDRSVLEHLKSAIATSRHQIALSQVMRWNIIPLTLFISLGLWNGYRSYWMILLTIAVFSISFYISSFEHTLYLRRKKELENLLGKLLGN